MRSRRSSRPVVNAWANPDRAALSGRIIPVATFTPRLLTRNCGFCSLSPTSAAATLARVSLLPLSSLNVTFNLMVFPWSSSVSV